MYYVRIVAVALRARSTVTLPRGDRLSILVPKLTRFDSIAYSRDHPQRKLESHAFEFSPHSFPALRTGRNETNVLRISLIRATFLAVLLSETRSRPFTIIFNNLPLLYTTTTLFLIPAEPRQQQTTLFNHDIPPGCKTLNTTLPLYHPETTSKHRSPRLVRSQLLHPNRLPPHHKIHAPLRTKLDILAQRNHQHLFTPSPRIPQPLLQPLLQHIFCRAVPARDVEG